MKHIIGIYQEHYIVRVNLRISPKCLIFIFKIHNPAMRHCPIYRNSKFLTCHYGGRTGSPTDICCSCAVDCRINIMRPPCSKIRDTASLRCPDNPAGLGRNKELVIDLRENRRLDQLCINQRRNDRNDRLVGVHNRSFWKSINISYKSELFQILQKFF